MNARLRRPLFVLLTVPGVLADASVAAHETKERVAIEWKRDPKAVVRRAEAAPPEAPEPPSELAIPPEARRRTWRRRARGGRRRAAP